MYEYQDNPRPLRVVLLVERGGSYERGILQGISNYANSHTRWLLTNQRSRAIRGRGKLRLPFDGMIAHNLLPNRQIELSKTPTVVLTRTADRMPIPYVTCDDEKIAGLAADHLIEMGLAAFGYVGLKGKYRSALRFEAFSQRLEKRFPGIEVPSCDDLRFELNTEESIEQIRLWVDRLKPPLGLFCFNDNVAEDVCEAIAMAGLRIPNDVAVLGVDNDESIADFTHASLSSVDPDAERIGFEAAKMLDQLMKSPKAENLSRSKLIPPLAVVARGSTDVMHHDDPAIAAAMAYMRIASRGGSIRIEDVVDASGVSRATLFRRFKKKLGFTPQKQIDQLKMTHVMQHLRHTELSIGHIAIKCGFRDPSALSMFVRRMTGRSPRDLRIADKS